MNNYDPAFLDIFVPLIVVQVPEDSDITRGIDAQLDPYKLDDSKWDNSILKNRLSNTKFSFHKHVGDDTQLLDELLDFKESEKHSKLSPFNVKSELFPNGILSAKWFQKYRQFKPFAFIQILPLPADDSSDDELVAKINRFKENYAALGVKYVCILTSESESVQEDEPRVSKIRQLTGLTRLTGVLYLNSNHSFEKECEVAISGLCSSLKNTAVEFYKAIEMKIKQRNKKYYSIPSSNNIDTTIELTPKFLETRNLIKQAVIGQYTHPHNLETSIHSLELAYQNLILIVQENFFEFSKDKVSSHDLRLYVQFRTLTDVLAFHIVRSYLSLEDPITALRKHAAHILNVSNTTKGKIEINQWVSIQYEWLGELLSKLPKSILSSANIATFNNKRRNYRAIEYYGGIKFTDGTLDIILNPALVYTKAESFLCSSYVSEPKQLDFLEVYRTDDEVKTKRLELLEKAASLMSSQSQKGESSYQYICYKIAEEHFIARKYEKAVEYYNKTTEGSHTWGALNNQIISRIIACYRQLGKHDEAFLKSLTATGPFEHDFTSLSNKLDYGSEFFELDTLFADGKKCNGRQGQTSVFDTLVCQIKLTPKVNFNNLKDTSGKNVATSLCVNKISVKYELTDKKVAGASGLKDIEVTHDASVKDAVLQEIVYGQDTKANLAIDGDFKVLQLKQEAEKSGTYQVKTISVDATLTIEGSKKVEVAISGNYGHTVKGSGYQWFYRYLDNKLTSVPVSLPPSTEGKVTVSPIEPDIDVTMASPGAEAIIVGERLCLPLDIHFKADSKVNYKNISLSPRVKIVCNEDSPELINPKVNWDSLKDDEDLVLATGDKKQVNLFLAVHSTSLSAEEELKKSQKSYSVVLDLKAIVVEDEEENGEGNTTPTSDSLLVYETAQFTLKVINTPFETKFSVSPRYREDTHSDMPSPFILHEQEQSHLSMPIVTRVWSGNLTLIDQLVRYAQPDEPLEIVNIVHNIRPKQPDIIVGLLPQSGVSQQRLFTTKSKNGVSQRNVTVIASAEVEWKRSGSADTNMLQTEEWEIMLPVADPRVLLAVEKLEAEKTVKLKYIIENPTPRIFTFSSKLSDENERFVWNFDDRRNMYPLVQAKFPVLPFNRFQLEYFATYNSAESIIQLPQLKVFDMQYKVSLPTLPVVGDVNIKDNNKLYWRAK